MFKLQKDTHWLYSSAEQKSLCIKAKNRKLYVSKHLYECSNDKSTIMTIYLTNDYSLFQIKEKCSLINLKQHQAKPNCRQTHSPHIHTLIHTRTHTHTHTHTRTDIHIPTQLA